MNLTASSKVDRKIDIRMKMFWWGTSENVNLLIDEYIVISMQVRLMNLV